MPRRKKETPQTTAIVNAIAQPHPRVKAYAEIIDVVTSGIKSYYEIHPEWKDDERAKQAANCSFFGMQAVLEVLDRYEISYKLEKEEAG